MVRYFVALLVGIAFTVAAVRPAAAHSPCEAQGPGHSGYAQHHIVLLAHEGELGADAHIPGAHQGYAGICGVLAGE